MANFILHVGDGKCGSSSIQASLFQAREALAQQGLVYETATPRSGHFSMVRLIGGTTRGDDTAQLTMAERSRERIRQALRPDSTVILSAENFLALDPERVLDLCRMISPEIGDVRVIAYVRPPESMYLSLVQQQLKADHRYVLPQVYQRPIDRYLSRWSDRVGHENLSVGLFDRARLRDGDVVADFAARLSALSGAEIGLGSSQSNLSLTAEQLIVLQQMRLRWFGDVGGRRQRESDRLAQMFLDLNQIALRGTRLALSAPARQALRAKNTPIFARAARFLETDGAAGEVPDEIPVAEGLVGEPDEQQLAEFRSEDVSTILESFDQEEVAALEALFLQPEGGSPAEQSRARQALTTLLGADREERAAKRTIVRKYFDTIGQADVFQQLQD